MPENFDPALVNVERIADELAILAKRWSRKPAQTLQGKLSLRPWPDAYNGITECCSVLRTFTQCILANHG
ncbi:MAG: hypothetical protein WDN29_01500 [Methylovirgula sp.]